MQLTQPTTQGEARQQAIDWQVWQATQSLSYGELAGWARYFYAVAQKFDLIDEFRENGII
jgi:hypothetical protein